MIDGIAASLVLTCLWSGWGTGSIYQIGQTVTIFMAALIARAVTLPVARFVVNVQGSQDPDHATGVAFIGAFIVIYGVLWVGVIRLTEEMRNFHQRGPGDKFIGAAIGGVRGALFGVVLAVGILNLTYDRANELIHPSFVTSRLGPTVVQNDFLSRFADKLDEELEERGNRPEEVDPNWDVPQ